MWQEVAEPNRLFSWLLQEGKPKARAQRSPSCSHLSGPAQGRRCHAQSSPACHHRLIYVLASSGKPADEMGPFSLCLIASHSGLIFLFHPKGPRPFSPAWLLLPSHTQPLPFLGNPGFSTLPLKTQWILGARGRSQGRGGREDFRETQAPLLAAPGPLRMPGPDPEVPLQPPVSVDSSPCLGSQLMSSLTVSSTEAPKS